GTADAQGGNSPGAQGAPHSARATSAPAHSGSISPVHPASGDSPLTATFRLQRSVVSASLLDRLRSNSTPNDKRHGSGPSGSGAAQSPKSASSVVVPHALRNAVGSTRGPPR